MRLMKIKVKNTYLVQRRLKHIVWNLLPASPPKESSPLVGFQRLLVVMHRNWCLKCREGEGWGHRKASRLVCCVDTVEDGFLAGVLT